MTKAKMIETIQNQITDAKKDLDIYDRIHEQSGTDASESLYKRARTKWCTLVELAEATGVRK